VLLHVSADKLGSPTGTSNTTAHLFKQKNGWTDTLDNEPAGKLGDPTIT
jgi:hypothetical protein